MPIESYPTFDAAGALVGRLIRTRLADVPELTEAQRQAVSEYLGELTQKALEIQFVVNQCLAVDTSDRLELADLFSTAEILASHVAAWRDNVDEPLLDAVERLREAAKVPA
ncbi:MAG: hypothetical protein ACRDI2_18460 [Chloroflexota bacterium]